MDRLGHTSKSQIFQLYIKCTRIFDCEMCPLFAFASILHLVALVLFKRFTFGLCGDGENEREAEDEDDDPLPMTAQNEPNTHACAWKLARQMRARAILHESYYRNNKIYKIYKNQLIRFYDFKQNLIQRWLIFSFVAFIVIV